MSKIKFGTDGWRAIVGQDFNEENVKKVRKFVKFGCHYSKRTI